MVSERETNYNHKLQLPTSYLNVIRQYRLLRKCLYNFMKVVKVY